MSKGYYVSKDTSSPSRGWYICNKKTQKYLYDDGVERFTVVKGSKYVSPWWKTKTQAKNFLRIFKVASPIIKYKDKAKHGDFGFKICGGQLRLAVTHSRDREDVIYHCNDVCEWDTLPGEDCAGRLDEEGYANVGNIFELLKRGKVICAFTPEEAMLLFSATGNKHIMDRIEAYNNAIDKGYE